MFHKSLIAIALTLTGAALHMSAATAQTPLTQAVVQSLRKQVRLMPSNQRARAARVSDRMVPGDAVATARQSLVELRFNDRSLARIGEQALFHFAPNTRSFDLRNGTVLMLIPRGQGVTRLKTPNAAAGIKGSALFARYIEETNTSFFGALTQSEIEISNQDGTQRRVLEPGEMATVTNGQIVNVQTFDLRRFYETSSLAEGLDLTQLHSSSFPDAALDTVRAETVDALRKQAAVRGDEVTENPDYLKLPARMADGGFPSTSRPPIPGEPETGLERWPSSLSPLTTGVDAASTPRHPGVTPVATTTQTNTSSDSTGDSSAVLIPGPSPAPPLPTPPSGEPSPPAGSVPPSDPGNPTSPPPVGSVPPSGAPAPSLPPVSGSSPPAASVPTEPVPPPVGSVPGPAPAPSLPTPSSASQGPTSNTPTVPAAVTVTPSVTIPSVTVPSAAPAPTIPAATTTVPAAAPAPTVPTSTIPAARTSVPTAAPAATLPTATTPTVRTPSVTTPVAVPTAAPAPSLPTAPATPAAVPTAAPAPSLPTAPAATMPTTVPTAAPAPSLPTAPATPAAVPTAAPAPSLPTAPAATMPTTVPTAAPAPSLPMAPATPAAVPTAAPAPSLPMAPATPAAVPTAAPAPSLPTAPAATVPTAAPAPSLPAVPATQPAVPAAVPATPATSVGPTVSTPSSVVPVSTNPF